MDHSEHRRRHERRFESRRDAAGRIIWQPDGDWREIVGWLSDRSRSSLTFVTASRGAPHRGQAIDVLVGQHELRRYRVTRTSAYDAACSLIACRSATPFNAAVPAD